MSGINNKPTSVQSGFSVPKQQSTQASGYDDYLQQLGNFPDFPQSLLARMSDGTVTERDIKLVEDQLARANGSANSYDLDMMHDNESRIDGPYIKQYRDCLQAFLPLARNKLDQQSTYKTKVEAASDFYDRNIGGGNLQRNFRSLLGLPQDIYHTTLDVGDEVYNTGTNTAAETIGEKVK